jgi:hypothetical protein
LYSYGVAEEWTPPGRSTKADLDAELLPEADVWAPLGIVPPERGSASIPPWKAAPCRTPTARRDENHLAAREDQPVDQDRRQWGGTAMGPHKREFVNSFFKVRSQRSHGG